MADIRKIVDELLATEKTPVGVPEWQPGPRATAEGQVRWSSPLRIDGEICPVNLIVDAYPRRRPETFVITIEMGLAIARVDYGIDDHFNGGTRRPADVPFGLVYGPHYHSWSINRRLATSKSLPHNLNFAMSLPAATRGFANAFRWLCGDANIAIGRNVPDLPASDLLL